jgi:mono/diheme cytochrome c family protein
MSRLWWRASLALVTSAICVAPITLAGGADAKTEKTSKADKKDEKKNDATKSADKKAVKKQLSGAELYSIHCGRCHAERYATEFTASQWQTIGTEMRVRANLPAAQARAIIKYLKEDSGTP